MSLQSRILKKSKNFVKIGFTQKKNIEFNPNYFLTSWAESIGYLNIKLFLRSRVSIIKKYKIVFKEFYSIYRDSLEYEDRFIQNKFDNIIMSYFFPENLNKNGSYDDRYFLTNTNSNKKNLWILIPLSKDTKNYKTDENVIILKRRKTNFYKNILLSSIMFLENWIRSLLFSKNENIKFKNSTFAKNLSKIIINLLIKKKISKFIFPYEAQPHQHFLVSEIKKIIQKVEVIGYMHTVIPPLPLDYIKRAGYPNLLLVNGITQKDILCEKLGWKKKDIKNITSLRYKKKSNFSFGKNIFLPYFLEDEKKMFDYFQKLIFSKKKYYFPKFNIRNHPSMDKSKKHLSLKKKLKEFFLVHKNYFNNTKKNKKISIFFGSTASVIEGLERGYKVFHICSDPALEKFDNFYWKKIVSHKLSSNIFEYSLRTKGEIIKFGSNKKNKSLPI